MTRVVVFLGLAALLVVSTRAQQPAPVTPRFTGKTEAMDGKDLTVGPCTLLGEVALFAETKRPATAKALEPATVLIIPRPLFIRMLDSFPDAARKLRETLAGRLDQATREIVNVRDFLDAHEPK